MDDVDITQEREERILKMNIAHSLKPVVEVVATGKCLNCGAEVDESNRRWCNSECRHEWEDMKLKGWI